MARGSATHHSNFKLREKAPARLFLLRAVGCYEGHKALPPSRSGKVYELVAGLEGRNDDDRLQHLRRKAS